MSKEMQVTNGSNAELMEILQKAKNDLSQTNGVIAQTKAKEIEVSMITAKRFPRDITTVCDNVQTLCGRKAFAESAEFIFPRAGKDIRGASVKLMEAIAQLYGNIDFGVTVISRNADNSECEAFAWDMENNVKVKRSFTVGHYRDTKNGKTKLTDERDIREMEMNYGSRNVRACLERVIPRFIVDEAVENCRKTLNASGKTLQERIESCKDKFMEKYELNGQFLEKLAGAKIASWTNAHISRLVAIFNSLENGDTSIKDLEANFTQTISAKQAKELATMIGADESKIAILKGCGFDITALTDIPAERYNDILEAILN